MQPYGCAIDERNRDGCVMLCGMHVVREVLLDADVDEVWALLTERRRAVVVVRG